MPFSFREIQRLQTSTTALALSLIGLASVASLDVFLDALPHVRKEELALQDVQRLGGPPVARCHRIVVEADYIGDLARWHYNAIIVPQAAIVPFGGIQELTSGRVEVLCDDKRVAAIVGVPRFR